MATLLLRLSLLLTFLAITVTARPGRLFHPCHTLIFFSSTSSHPLPQNPNPNFLPHNPTTTATISFSSPRSVTFFFARPINPHPKPQIIVDRATTPREEENHPLLPFGSTPPRSAIAPRISSASLDRFCWVSVAVASPRLRCT